MRHRPTRGVGERQPPSVLVDEQRGVGVHVWHQHADVLPVGGVPTPPEEADPGTVVLRHAVHLATVFDEVRVGGMPLEVEDRTVTEGAALLVDIATMEPRLVP